MARVEKPKPPVIGEGMVESDEAADIASLKSFLAPRSIAVIGASRKKGTIGNQLFHNILHQEFNGVVYPVNPHAEMVASVKTYSSVLDIPGIVDLAVVIVPAEDVLHAVEECGQKGIPSVVVISAGFGESGAEGKVRQERLLDVVHRYGMRLLGPNCMGIINTAPQVNMNATFSSVFPPIGNIAFSTQSGAFGLAILEYARSLNMGLSTFVSVGNNADVSSTDLLEYWQEDPATDIILLYLESFGKPRKFARVARSITPVKPIVAVKSGRTPAGSRAAASHTGALATAEVASEALFKQAGIIRVDTLEELFDIANLLFRQLIPSGNRVAILTNAGGPGIMTADACVARGLEFPDLSESTIAALKRFMPHQVSLANPVDMTAAANAEMYRRALELLVQDNVVDIVIVIFIPPMLTDPGGVADAVREVAPQFRQHGKTIVASFMASPVDRIGLGPGSAEKGGVPCYIFPESAAVALGRAYEYSEWLKRPKGSIMELDGIDRQMAGAIITSAVERSKTRHFWLDTGSVIRLLNSYGINTVMSASAGTAVEASRAAKEIGFPVALKLNAASIVHKTEVGGVVLDLRSPKEVERAFVRMRERLERDGFADEMLGVTVQQMIPGGVEVIVGVTQDPSFGPLIMLGMGGIYTELFKDVTFRIHPLTDEDAREMVRSVKAYQLLAGWRGANPSDVGSLEELLLRISAMVEDLPQILELDLNPVKVLERGGGYVVVDARILLA